MAVKHTFVSPKSDGADATLVRPSNWNEDHVIEVSTIATQHLGGDITAVGAALLTQATQELVRVYIGVNVSTAAFTLATDYAASTHIHDQYQTVSTLSSAAYTVSSIYATAAQGALADTSLQNAGAFDAAGANSTAVATHVALADPHTQYQMVSSLSSAAYQVTSHFAISTHATRHITGGADIIPNFTATESGLVPLSGGGTTNFLRADGTFVAPSGGSDPWTYVKVSSNHFGTSSSVFVDIPGLRFTPGTNSTYEWEFQLMLKTSTAAITPRVGVRWPTGTSSAGWINQGQTNSTQLFTWGNQISTMNIPAAGLLATTTGAWNAIGGGCVYAYGAAASSFGLMLATETSGTMVSSMIGSYLKYRTY